MRHTRRLVLSMLCLGFWGPGCGPTLEEPASGAHRLRLSGGTYSDGSGWRGLALLATLREPPALVTDATVNAQPSSGARVSWTAVPNARSYYVSVWSSDLATLVSGLWVTAPDVAFSPGTFSPGQRYAVYVAATNVDLSSPTPPARLGVSENSYFPTTFTAP